MKHLKSILSLFLVLAILPLGVFAAADDVTQTIDAARYSTDLEFLTSLGIAKDIDTTDLTRTLTRAEFTSMAVAMLNISPASSESTAFSDVTSATAYAPAIYTALGYGLLKGTSEGTFSPDKPITYAAALKILVAALGYEEYAYVSGGYPTGYIMQADTIGILDGIDAHSVDSPLTLGTAVSLVSNSLTCDIRKIVRVLDDYVETAVSAGDNCLTKYFRLTHISGIVTTAGYHSMMYGYNEENSYVEIAGLRLKSSLAGVQQYLGYSADAWYKADTKELVAILKSEVNTSVTIAAKDVAAYLDFKLTYYTDDTYSTKSYNLNRGYSFVLNGRLFDAADSDFSFEHGTLTLIDNNGDKRYDVVIANKKTYMVVKGINSSTKTVYDRNRSDIQLVLDNEDGYHYTMLMDGEAVDHSAIEAGMVLEVSQSGDGYIADVVIATGSKRGSITAIGQDTICIDDAEYETNEYFDTYCTPELGQSGTFLLDPDGRITFIADRYINSVQYGYFLDMAVHANALSADNVKIKVFTDSGDVEIFTLAEKVNFDGVLVSNPADLKDDLTKQQTIDGKQVDMPIYQLIRFGTDGKGLVNLIDRSADVANNSDMSVKYAETISDNSLTRYVMAENKTHTNTAAQGNAYWRKVGNAFAPYFTLGNTTIIQVPTAIINTRLAAIKVANGGTLSEGETTELSGKFDDSAFSIIGAGSLPNYGWRYVDAYDYDDSMTPKIVVMYYSTATPGSITKVVPEDEATIHLVEKAINCINDEGEETIRIYSYADGKFQINDIAPEVVNTLKNDGLIPQAGEAVRLAFSAKGINGIARDIKCQSDGSFVVQYGVDGVSESPIETHTYVTGKVFSCVDGSLVIKTDNYPSSTGYPVPTDGLCSLRASSNTMVAIFNKASGSIEHASLSDISDIRSVGEAYASYVCIGLGAYKPEFIIIYR